MKLLLDEHLDPALVPALRRKFSTLDVASVPGLGWAGLDDPALLEVLDGERRVLVTRDVHSVPEHISDRLAQGLTHGGVVYVPRSIVQGDRKTLLRRLVKLVKEHGDDDWTCREFWL
jgi:hypothetical protein